MKKWVFLWLLVPAVAIAANSANYRIEEDFIGVGGLIEESSANFKAAESIGDTAVGESASTNYQIDGGYTTTNDPALAFIVNTTSIAFGALSPSTTKTGTSTFTVLNYTSHGYIVQTIGSPPTNGGYTLAGMSSTGPSVAGTEQYGINLKANTSPVTFGAEAVQDPDPTFSFGAAAAGYNATNQYRYVAGETIAQATKSSGRTNYTISYIVNVSITTAGGAYTGTQELICIGTY